MPERGKRSRSFIVAVHRIEVKGLQLQTVSQQSSKDSLTSAKSGGCPTHSNSAFHIIHSLRFRGHCSAVLTLLNYKDNLPLQLPIANLGH